MSLRGTRLATAQTDGADHKSRFQELAAQLGAGPPRYEVEASGPDHARTFRVVAMLDGVAHGEGEGRSKKQAEQAAARAAVESLTTGGLPAQPAEPTIEPTGDRSEEHTSELQSLMRISYAVFCLKKKNK